MSTYTDISPRGGGDRQDLGELRQTKARIARTEMARLRTVEPAQFVARIVLFGVLMSANSLGIVGSHGLLKLVLQILQGALFAHGIELVHQCLHKTGTGSARVDYGMGMVLGWLPGVSFWRYLYWHFYHHAHNGQEDDKESFGYAYQLLQSPSRKMRLLGMFNHLSSISHYMTTFRRMALAVRGTLRSQLREATPEMPERIAYRIQRDYRIMAGILVTGVAITLICKTSIVVDLWFMPILIGYSWIHPLIELPEHFGCDRPSGDSLSNTRSIRASWFGRWFTNYNSNHVGHHTYPLIPMHKVPEVESLLLQDRGFKYLEESYPSFYLRFLRYVWSGKRD